jgi:hypothetical protein
MIFNDHVEQHIESLRATIGTEIQTENGQRLATVEYHTKEFDAIFPELIKKMESSTNLLFIDQFGTNQVDETRFLQLHALARTDLLFFIDSRWFRRFAERPEAKSWNVLKEDIGNVDYFHVHRFMTDHFQRLVGSEYYIAPFSLKKGSNIYGLVFASHHPLGLEKFLEVAWTKDPHTGEANFDIDREGNEPSQLSFVEASKVTAYRAALKRKIERHEFASDAEIYVHMLQSGFLNRHTKPIISDYASKKATFMEFRDKRGTRKQPRLSGSSLKDPRWIHYFKGTV